MSMNRAGNLGALKPDEVAGLIIEPALSASIFAQAANQISFNSANLRIPRVADGSAAWTSEGAEIGVSDATISEVVAPAKAIKALTFLSNELVADGNPNTLELIGNAAARQIAAELDKAAFANTTTNGPVGVESVAGLAYDENTDLTNLDDIQLAVAAIQSNGYNPSVLVTTPEIYAELSILKTGTGSNVPLLQTDATQGVGRNANGLTVLVSAKVTPGTLYVWDTTQVILGVRQDAELVVSDDAAFSSDRKAIRAVARFAVAFPAPKAVARLSAPVGSV
ncbi:phage major capsid protein [Gordonia polyisoprenivorans]|uniref:phage major capsid protein n=1 Tax=Gordonia polyisoprenivorans TaxID=84595 RepID=UPI001AD6B685|nr:phage major capsid protein [Gordonia polyisoprenivorans]QTI67653.1 phage major capsid protein [Gordonia polyisoprenivorans]